MPDIKNPAAAWGQSFLPQNGAGDTEVVRIAANAISAGELVALSTSAGYVIRNLVATAAGIQCGVALNTAAAGKSVTITTYGPARVLKGTAALTAGNVAKADATVSGTVGQVTGGVAITTLADARGFVGTIITSATAGDTTVDIFVGKV